MEYSTSLVVIQSRGEVWVDLSDSGLGKHAIMQLLKGAGAEHFTVLNAVTEMADHFVRENGRDVGKGKNRRRVIDFQLTDKWWTKSSRVAGGLYSFWLEV